MCSSIRRSVLLLQTSNGRLGTRVATVDAGNGWLLQRHTSAAAAYGTGASTRGRSPTNQVLAKEAAGVRKERGMVGTRGDGGGWWRRASGMVVWNGGGAWG